MADDKQNLDGDSLCNIDGIYDQLRDLAWMLMRHEASGSITPTDLIHEAFVKIGKTESGFEFKEREHAVRTIVQTMRHVLIDRIRKRRAARRDSARTTHLLEWNTVVEKCSEPWVSDLDEALERLAEVDKRAAEVVQLRFFGGLTGEEISGVLSINERTVRRDWSFAQAWLSRELSAQ